MGDPEWQARLDQGIECCDGVILNLTSAACEAEPVCYEVKKPAPWASRSSPIILEKIDDWGTTLEQGGLSVSHHTADFTNTEK